MSEWLTTGQMIDTLKVGEVAESDNRAYKAYWRDATEGNKLTVIDVSENTLNDWLDKSLIENDYKWRILPKYVGFEEAMRAYEKGYDLIFHDGDGKTFSLSNHEVNMVRIEKTPIGVFSLKSLYKGKWTIEDDSND